MSKRTPGPWRFEPAGKRLRVVGARGVWLATAEYAPAHDVEPGDVDRAQAEANARLIAAAPDLLAALQAMLTALDCESVSYREIEAAEAAIAKAEGRDA